MARRHLSGLRSGEPLGHSRPSPAVGQPATWRTLPSHPTRRLGRPIEESQCSARSPLTIAAVLAELASRHEPAATVTVRQGPPAGFPVAGSMTWWAGPHGICQLRVATLEVAKPPPGRAIH